MSAEANIRLASGDCIVHGGVEWACRTKYVCTGRPISMCVIIDEMERKKQEPDAMSNGIMIGCAQNVVVSLLAHFYSPHFGSGRVAGAERTPLEFDNNFVYRFTFTTTSSLNGIL